MSGAEGAGRRGGAAAGAEGNGAGAAADKSPGVGSVGLVGLGSWKFFLGGGKQKEPVGCSELWDQGGGFPLTVGQMELLFGATLMGCEANGNQGASF